jgi:hypothetical protein
MEYEQFLTPFLLRIHGIIDNIDGLDTLFSYCESHESTHKTIFKNVYQKAIALEKDLGEYMELFLFRPYNTPPLGFKNEKFFKNLMDVLANLTQNSKIALKIKQFGPRSILELSPIDYITHPKRASFEYKKGDIVLASIRQLVDSFEKRVKNLYIQETGVDLLDGITTPPSLTKRHEILKLFDIA